MERRTVVEALRYDVTHGLKKKRSKIRQILEAEELEEIGGKLTTEEIKHIFGETCIYKQQGKFNRDGEIELIVSCKTCGKFMNLRWYYENIPDILEVWKYLTVGNKLYSPKDNILDCMLKLHEIEIRPYSDLVEARALRHELRHKDESERAEKLLGTILGETQGV